MVGGNNCEIEIKEGVILKLQADSRMGRRRALQVLAGEDEPSRSNHQSIPYTFQMQNGFR